MLDLRRLHVSGHVGWEHAIGLGILGIATILFAVISEPKWHREPATIRSTVVNGFLIPVAIFSLCILLLPGLAGQRAKSLVFVIVLWTVAFVAGTALRWLFRKMVFGDRRVRN